MRNSAVNVTHGEFSYIKNYSAIEVKWSYC